MPSPRPEETSLPLTLRQRFWHPIAGLVAWCVLVTSAWRIGVTAHRRNPSIPTKAAPFFGRYEVYAPLGFWRPIVAAVVIVSAWPMAMRRLRYRLLLTLSWFAAGIWPALLSTVGSWRNLGNPLGTRFEYLAVVSSIDSVRSFIDTFVDRYDSYPIHVQGHPPLAPVFFAGLERVGLGGAQTAGVIVVALAALSAPLLVDTVRLLASEREARRVAVFAGFWPASMTIATSVDGVIMTVAMLVTWAMVHLLLACESAARNRSVMWGLIAGTAAGVALFLTYGAPLLLAPAFVIAVVALRGRYLLPLAATVVGGVAIMTAFWLLGFNIFEGLETTRDAYAAGISQRRPFLLFTLINFGALAAISGPAVAAALAARRTWNRVDLLWLGAILGVLAATASGLSKGEVERIWLPFVPPLTAATVSLTHPRLWLGLQLTVCLFWQLIVRSPW